MSIRITALSKDRRQYESSCQLNGGLCINLQQAFPGLTTLLPSFQALFPWSLRAH
jgi:hypothetical protein